MIKKVLDAVINIFKKFDLEKVVTGIIITLIIGFPSIKLLSYILYYFYVIDDIFSINPVYLLWFSLPFLAIIYFICLITKKYEFNYSDYILFILVTFAIGSTVVAVDKNISIDGEIYRYEGLKSILAYYFIFLNAKNLKNQKYKKVIIDVLLGVAVFQVIYGLLQVYTNISIIKHFPKAYMAMALCGNPNFFGSYIVMPLMISTTNYLNSKKIRDLILSLIFFIGLCIANSSGPFLSFVISFIFLIIKFHKNFKIKEIIIIIISLIGIFYAIDVSLRYVQTKIMNNTIESSYNIKSEIIETVKGKNEQERIANGRLVVWKKSLPLIKKYWLLGAGLDNFAKVYPQSGNIIYDKAHNVYIQMAVTNGMIVLLLYCTICFIAFLKGFKFNDIFYIGIYMAFVVYSIQAFGNINVVDVTPIFYILLALIYSKDNKIIKENN